MIGEPLQLPCGARLPNRLVKAAMTEGLADGHGQPGPALARLYARWAGGGAGLLLSGNLMVDRRYLERPGNVIVDDPAVLPALQRWVAQVHAVGGRLWAQLNHPGRQCPRLVHPVPISASDIALPPWPAFGRPRPAREDEIHDVVRRFGDAAVLCQEAGFDGVQIHAAHGYLISQFLSPRTNHRADGWGGDLRQRARLLLAIVAAVRQRVGTAFPVAVKLNASDLVPGGLTAADGLQVATWLDEAGVDLLEVSGGSFENVAWLDRPRPDAGEAPFAAAARALRSQVRMPVMLTGGLRSRARVEAALAGGVADLVGFGRPFCIAPDFPSRLQAGEIDVLPSHAAPPLLAGLLSGLAGRSRSARALERLAEVAWHYHQIERLADGLDPDLGLSMERALALHLRHEAGRLLERAKAGSHPA